MELHDHFVRSFTNSDLKCAFCLQASEEVAVFEQIEMDEYERRQESRKNDDFIVDDEGYGYTDKGGEIWEYEDHQANSGRNGRKQRKTNVKNNHGIDEFMQPMSTVAPIKKKSAQIIRKQPLNVSEAQSKDIMNNLLGELDKNDEDDLQEIGETHAGVLDQIGTDALQDTGQVAFNQSDKLNQKYNIAVNQISSKKRGIDQISNVAAQRRHNPFAKSNNDDVEIITPEQAETSLFKKDAEVEKSPAEAAAPVEQPPAGDQSEPMVGVTEDASKMQEKMLDKATNEAKFELKETKETEMDKEWRQIQQNQ